MNALKRELLTFIGVGILNTLFGYSLFCLFIFMGMQHIVAISLSFFCGTLFNFQTIGRFVFQSHNNKLILRFFLLYIFLYFANLSLLETLKLIFESWYLAGAISILITAVLSFILNKFWVFKKKGAS